LDHIKKQTKKAASRDTPESKDRDKSHGHGDRRRLRKQRLGVRWKVTESREKDQEQRALIVKANLKDLQTKKKKKILGK